MANLLRFIIFSSFLTISFASPVTGSEDDEYDEDPEYYPEKIKAAMLKIQEDLKTEDLLYFLSSNKKPTVTPIPKVNKKGQWQIQNRKRIFAKDSHGYQIVSDGPQIETQLLKNPQMVKIRVEAPGVRDIERSFGARHVQFKIRRWNRVYKVQVKVPFGIDPEMDLKIVEMKGHIDVMAPVSDENLYPPYPFIP